MKTRRSAGWSGGSTHRSGLILGRLTTDRRSRLSARTQSGEGEVLWRKHGLPGNESGPPVGYTSGQTVAPQFVFDRSFGDWVAKVRFAGQRVRSIWNLHVRPNRGTANLISTGHSEIGWHAHGLPGNESGPPGTYTSSQTVAPHLSLSALAVRGLLVGLLVPRVAGEDLLEVRAGLVVHPEHELGHGEFVQNVVIGRILGT